MTHRGARKRSGHHGLFQSGANAMRNHVREVKKEIQLLKDSGEIEDFVLSRDAKHPTIKFKLKGRWHDIPFASSPRTPYANNFTRQQVRRRIRQLQGV